MAHQQQIDFCQSVKRTLPIFFTQRLVVDIGSLDINGNNQYLFEDCLYLGIDLKQGKNVDFASKGHELLFPNESVDVIISTECFEHDSFYELTLRNIIRMLKPGGLFLFSCATTGRPEHGTRRTTPNDAPFIQELNGWGDYYKNLEEKDIRSVIDIESIFKDFSFSINEQTHDLYFWGVKNGVLMNRTDYSFIIKENEYKNIIVEIGKNLELKDKAIQDLDNSLHAKNILIKELNEKELIGNEKIKKLNQEIFEKELIGNEKIKKLNQEIFEKDKKIHEISYDLLCRKGYIETLEKQIVEENARFNKLTSSRSWMLTKPLRVAARLLRGETAALFPIKLKSEGYQIHFRNFARTVYHKLPVSQSIKWRLRERFYPLLFELSNEHLNVGSAAKGLVASIVGSNKNLLCNNDYVCEQTLLKIVTEIGVHAISHGPASYFIALPFLSSGGAERVALNLCKAIGELQPGYSIVLLVTDRGIAERSSDFPDNIKLIIFDQYLPSNSSYSLKIKLLHDLLQALRPHVFHNINSEVAWHLIINDGIRLKKNIRLFASIFAFQFSSDRKTKIGYAEYFLRKALPYLTGLISDNYRFINDAIKEYSLTESECLLMKVLYQPCRLVNEPPVLFAQKNSTDRLQVLWAGRLDEEKRIDLLFNIAKKCAFADFRVFGQTVLDKEIIFPELPNLSYEGAFASPTEWLENHSFDVFLFTSKWEGLPNTLLEVATLGIPIIAPSVGGVRELVTPDTGYLLSETASIDDYITALMDVKNNRNEAFARATRLYSLVQTRHSWPAFLSSVLAIPQYILPLNISNKREDVAWLYAYKKPCVSIIIPCYNQGRYLFESITSALMATDYNIEIIVIDDGSTESKITYYLDEIQSLFPDTIRVLRQTNQGLSSTRNIGLSLARGEFIQFLDADDLLLPGKLDAQVAQMIANPTIDVSVCNFLLCNEERDQVIKHEEAIAKFDLSIEDFLFRWERGFAIPIHCGLFRKKVISELKFDINMKAKEDWLFWTSLALNGASFVYINGHWASYRQHSESMRRSYVKMGQAWLDAGEKINILLKGEHPAFLGSVQTWFEQCYLNHPSYQKEISEKDRKYIELPSSQNTTVLTDNVIVADELLREFNKKLSKNTEAPLISIIVPIYGHYSYLKECLISLADQGDVSIEIICINDASPDTRVANLLSQLQGQLKQLKVISMPTNQGISIVQNIAVENARGEFVAFVDCDDALEANALSIIRDEILVHPEVDYFFTSRKDINESGDMLRVAHYGGYDAISFYSQEKIHIDLLGGMVASHLKIIRRYVYLEKGGCNPDFSGVQDWDLALRIANDHRLYYINKPLYKHRIHANSVTQSNRIVQFRKTNQVRRNAFENLFTNKKYQKMDTVILKKDDLPISHESVLRYRDEGCRLAFDARGQIDAASLAFLREFNSYFEKIYWDDPTLPIGMFGYVWDPSILKQNNVPIQNTANITL